MMHSSTYILFILIAFSEIVEGDNTSKNHSKQNITVLISDQTLFSAVYVNNKQFKQLDLMILDNFATKHDLKLDYHIINETLSFIFNSYDDSYTFPVIDRFRKIDILIGKIDENSTLVNEYFSPSRFYYYDELIWCIQEWKPIPVWKNFFEIWTDPFVWFIFAFTYLVGTISAYFLQTFEDLQPKWNFWEESISVLGHFVGFVYPYKPERTSNRIFYVVGCFACIIFTSSFISIVLKIMHKSIYKDQVSSIQNIVGSIPPYELTGDHFALQQLQKHNKTYSSEALAQFKICDNYVACLKQLEVNSKLAVAISNENVRWIRRNSTLQFRCLEKPEIINSFPLKFHINKNFKLRNELNEFIKASGASGLIEKWRSIEPRIHHRQIVEESTNGYITAEHAYGAVAIWFGMWSYKFVIFFLEILVHKKVRKPNQNHRQFWRFIEMIIDPERYFLNETKWI